MRLSKFKNTRVFALRIMLSLLPALAGKVHVNAQGFNLLWSQTFGGSNIDVGLSVQQTADFGFIIAGYTRSFGTLGGRDVMLLKTTQDGTMQWVKVFGGSGDDEGYSVKQTTDGGYVITGYTKSMGAGMKDVILIKTDANGIAAWVKTFGGTQDDEGYSVLQTQDGGFLVGGATSSSGAGSRDMYAVKTDASGNAQWTKTYGGMSSDGAWAIIATNDGGYALAGWTFSYGGGYLGNAWLVKTDGNGNQLWQKAFGGTDVDRANDVKQLTDGGYVLAGYTSSSGAGLDDMLVIRTDPNGNAVWTKTFGGSGRDYGQSVIQLSPAGTLIIAGYTLSFGAGNEDFWLVHLDQSGNLLWQNTYGGSASDVAYSVNQTYDGGLIVTGHTLSFGAGVHDVWLLRLLQQPTAVPSIENQVKAMKNMAVYPNPFHSEFTVAFSVSSSESTTLQIFDLNGNILKEICHQALSPGLQLIHVENPEPEGGIYFCRIISRDFTETQKIIAIR